MTNITEAVDQYQSLEIKALRDKVKELESIIDTLNIRVVEQNETIFMLKNMVGTVRVPLKGTVN